MTELDGSSRRAACRNLMPPAGRETRSLVLGQDLSGSYSTSFSKRCLKAYLKMSAGNTLPYGQAAQAAWGLISQDCFTDINFFKRKHEQDLAGKDLPKTSASARKSTRIKLM